MTLLQASEWIEATSVGVMVRESTWGFPILVAIHIIGLTLSVGLLVWFDLRLLGAGMRAVPVASLYRRLLPWMRVGFVVMFASGGMLFAGFATRAGANTFFRLKMAGLALAAVNAVVYHLVTERTIAQWNESAPPPFAVRAAGLISMSLWAGIILAGRMMSYTMF